MPTHAMSKAKRKPLSTVIWALKGWIASSIRMSKTFGIDFPFDLVVRWNPASALSTKDDVLFSGSGFVVHRPFFIPLVATCPFLIDAHRNGSRVIITTASSLSTPHRGGIPVHPPPHGARVRALRHRGPRPLRDHLPHHPPTPSPPWPPPPPLRWVSRGLDVFVVRNP